MRDGLYIRWRVIPEGTTEFYAFLGSSGPAPLLLSSAGVFDSSGVLVRTLFSATSFPQNSIPSWDGTLDDGSVAPSGTYTIKLLTNKVSYDWQGSVGNSSPVAQHYNNIYYHNEAATIQNMAITPSGLIYYTHQYDERWPTVHLINTSDVQTAQYPVYVSARGPYGSTNQCCTDGTYAYFGTTPTGLPTVSFVWAVKCNAVMPISQANESIVDFPSGTPSIPGYFQGGPFGVIAQSTVVTPFDNLIQGLAVQQAGNLLFISQGIQNTLITANKTTGATLNTDTTTFTQPNILAIDPTTDAVWVTQGFPATTVGKYTANAITGVLTSAGINIVGLQNAVGVAVSPDGSTILIADGGTAQQVKAFNTSDGSAKVAFGTGGVFGTAGGYTNSPAVTNTKFMFSNTTLGFATGLGFLCFSPDGSWWLGDCGNCRAMHFSSGNSPSLIEQINNIPSFYSCRVCQNDDTRVFSGFLEWKIDYNKSFDVGTGAWTLVNNWATLADIGNQYDRLRWVGTYSNGKTYAGSYNNSTTLYDVYELTSTGLRSTGQTFGNRISIDKDFNQFYIEPVGAGSVAHISKNAFTGFDGSDNPTWAHTTAAFAALYAANDPSVVVCTTQTLPSLFPDMWINDGNLVPGCQLLANGILPIWNANSSSINNHVGGIDFTSGNVKFSTHPVNPTNHGGTHLLNLIYPENPYFGNGAATVDPNGGGGCFYRAGEQDFFTCVRGEDWGGNQTNEISHWHQSGLLVNRFGSAAPYFGAGSLITPNVDVATDTVNSPQAGFSFKGMAGLAGNTAWGGLAKVSGNYYLYQNDEWYHGGITSWKISNLSSIAISDVTTIFWNSGNYLPSSDPTDMLAGLPYNAGVPSGTASWTRSDPDILINSFTGPWFKVYTNCVLCNPHTSPDITIEGIGKAIGSYTVTRPLTRSGTGNWLLDMKMLQSGIGFFEGGASDTNLFIDVIDNVGKVIIRMNNGINGGSTFWVNGVAIRPVLTNFSVWLAIAGAIQALTVTSNIVGGNVEVNYAGYSATMGVFDAGADISHPDSLRFTILGPNFSFVGASFTKINFA